MAHHRVAKARRDGVTTLPARKIPCPDHLAFLISTEGYDTGTPRLMTSNRRDPDGGKTPTFPHAAKSPGTTLSPIRSRPQRRMIQ